MRPLLLLLAIAGITPAQLRDLATTGNGAAVYFSNQTPLQGSSQPAQGRIYKIAGNGLELVMDLPKITFDPTVVLPKILTTYYDLTHPQVSRDGSILAVTGRRACAGNCAAAKIFQTTVTGLASGTATFVGTGNLSGNGRYLLLYRDGSLLPYEYVVDLQSGQMQVTSFRSDSVFAYGRIVADDGTVVWPDRNSFVLLQGTTELKRVSRSPDSIIEAVIDSAARVVLYSLSKPGGLNELHVYQTATDKDIVLAASGSDFAAYLSADGLRAMFLSTASGSQQVWTVNTDGSELRQVTHDAAGVLSAAMSDDGNMAWLSSGSGRLFQLNLSTGVATEKLARTPQVYGGSPVIPGSALTIQGAGFSDEAVMAQSFPLPFELGGVKVATAGIAAPLLSVSPTMIVAQAPWEVPAEDHPSLNESVNVDVTVTSSSPFSSPPAVSATALLAYGSFVTAGGLDAVTAQYPIFAIHEAWDGQVTPSNPARPNEILHLYGTGFGTVDSPPATGMPSPANPPAHTTVLVTCTYFVAGEITARELPVLFSGLAPGLVGYYQLDIRLPDSLPTPTIRFGCRGEGDTTSATFGGELATGP